MENNANAHGTREARGLRKQGPVIYFPKAQLFNVIERKSTDTPRRSKSLEQLQEREHNHQPGRRSTSAGSARRRCNSGVSDLPRGSNQPGRRAIRSVSVDGGRRGCNSGAIDFPRSADQPGRRAERSMSVDARCRGRISSVNNVTRRADQRVDVPCVDTSATIGHLAQSQAILANELIKMKDEICAHSKKNDLLTKQNSANQELIAKMAQEIKQKDAQIRGLINRLQTTLNRIGNSCMCMHI